MKGKERDGKKDASLGQRGVSVARRGLFIQGLHLGMCCFLSQGPSVLLSSSRNKHREISF